MRLSKSTLITITVAVVSLCSGILAGLFLIPFLQPDHAKITEIREFNNTYHFINPLLACAEDLSVLKSDEAKKLQDDLQNAITRHTQAGDITEASIYFRDLKNGPWVGIAFNDPFTPGSLLKVPLAISVYKSAESDPTLLTRKLEYTGNEVDDPQFYSPQPFPKGSHTVEELVRQMLINSDNDAANVLANTVGAAAFTSTFDHLGITEPTNETPDYTTTTREYGSFFRILYNATFLDSKDSEHILSLLAESTFKEGIVAGVDSGVVVSHKFGERTFTDTGVKQLHDCGIVYAPNHPYLLCIMTRGSSYPAMATTIADISRITYRYVSK